MTKKIVNYILFITFTLFAVIQLNDPDSILWFSIYFFVALICLIANFKTIPKSILIITITGLLAFSAFHFSLFIDYLHTENKEEIFGAMVYEKPYLEGTREFIGLLIAAVGVIYQLKKPKRIQE
ncbi:transmembrane 220 family protein [Flavivirga aquimarina]|uniref:Transmembrane 220 family protein n=1 Tax=Flavivirga aquimarina TaxID=2027862 RepID=A0ABT8WGR3_9FLAO|nr:transmembrane 220 family protein [Flavivirga aquimarina]MDO5972345.1 transmembrane 220 family protein [Flavivirga aquimarina]